jgi:hypothetical protein
MKTLATQLEQRTKLITYQNAIQLLNSDEYERTQSLNPCNLNTTAIRLDEEKGGIFFWSFSAQRYFLLGKRK